MTPLPLHYATYFDRHYLTRGLALYRSLCKHSPAFRLWVLSLDEETYATLHNLQLKHLRLVSIDELERADPALLEAKPTRRAFEYYWTCGPAFLVYLFRQYPQVELLTYLDADLFFFSDPTPLYDELGDGSVLLIESRFARSVPDLTKQKGTFSVGLLVFRRSESALACLGRWRQQCLDWCFDRVEPTRFGDQKYLDDWPIRYEGVRVAQCRGASLGPWNLSDYRIHYEDGKVRVDGNPVIFYHFNRFRVITRWLYDPAAWWHNQPVNPIAKRYIYGVYVRALRAASDLVEAAGGRVERVDTLRFGPSKLLALARMARRRSFLIVTHRIVL